MKKILLLLAMALASIAQAARHQAPPSFPALGNQAVFVDFHSALYAMDFSVSQKSAYAESVITFEVTEAGLPLFDLVAEPIEVLLDGMPVETKLIQDPDKETYYRVVNRHTKAGQHILTVKHKITTNIATNADGVAAGFWTSDLNDRKYLEQYLPTSFEYDQYRMIMKVQLSDATTPHVIKSNGDVVKISQNLFAVSFPNFYTASSVYFHLFPEATKFNVSQFDYASIDGRKIPVDIYTTYNAGDFETATKNILAELETDYGPFPHKKLVIYGNSFSGGMEYAGATATSLSALGHELFHSYHARALMPANGNAGWMDEAMARWRDNKYPLLEKVPYDSTRLAGRSVWARKTDRMAYTEGSQFLSMIAFRMNEKGTSFKKLLRDYFEKYKFTTVTTELFKNEVAELSGLDIHADFDRYIYGKRSFLNVFKHVERDDYVTDEYIENDPHPARSKAELLELTLPQ